MKHPGTSSSLAGAGRGGTSSCRSGTYSDPHRAGATVRADFPPLDYPGASASGAFSGPLSGGVLLTNGALPCAAQSPDTRAGIGKAARFNSASARHPSAVNRRGRRAYFAKDATPKGAVGSAPTSALDPRFTDKIDERINPWT